jgi:hypothetical protein
LLWILLCCWLSLVKFRYFVQTPTSKIDFSVKTPNTKLPCLNLNKSFKQIYHPYQHLIHNLHNVHTLCFFTGLIFLKNTHFLYQSGSLKLRIRFAVCTIRCTVSYLCKLHHKMSFCTILNRGENRNVCIYPVITCYEK